ncbi:MAG: nucleotidyl transferase AbiEii/AbiGii toxin family protein [Bdellovibrionales bacterium]|nr:nucleotidyl transferase AbiEii/AbiGii toxin family protein [Bdellovibrionales bacterium]
MWTPHEIDISNISFQVYPPEFIFAEKLETIVRFGTGNTRVKDFIDLDTLIKSV